MTALYGPFIFYQTTLLRDWLLPILEPLAVLALLKARTSDRPYAWGLAGVCLGVAVLCKPTASLLMLAALVWIVHDHWKEWRQTSHALSSVIIGVLLVLTPVLIRNAIVGAPLFALSTRTVEAFVLANTDNTSETVRKVFERSRGNLSQAVRETITLHYEGRTSFFAIQVDKMRVLANPYEKPNNTSFDYGREISPILRWTLDYRFVFPLGLVGLMMCLKTWRSHLLVLLYGLASLVGVLITSPISRYRLVVVPVLILYGAAVLIHWVDDIRERRIGRVLGISGLVLMVALIQLVVFARQGPTFAHDYYNSAVAYRKQNDFDKATRTISTLSRKLMTESPTSRAAYEATGMEGDYRAEWAKRLIRKKQTTLAKEQVELAAAAYARDPTLVLSHFNLGVLYVGVGEFEKAKRSLGRFLGLAPDSPKAALARTLLLRIEQHSKSGAREQR